MSSQHLEKITCPKCQKDSEFVMYDSVNLYEKVRVDGNVVDCALLIVYGILAPDSIGVRRKLRTTK